jgi:RND family efflux transporter MFP subunit
MDQRSDVRLRWTTLLAGAVLLVFATGLAVYLVMGRGKPVPATESVRAPASPTQASVPPASSGAAPLADVSIPLTAEAVQRAGIEVTPASASSAGGRVQIPGVVQPNAYKSVSVTPLVGGRITRVLVELGQSVRRGQLLAEMYSPELAEAQTRYVSARAALDAHERELRRTEQLAEIGAASRQELERVHAEHAAETTMVDSERSRLTLLGMSEPQIARLTSGTAVSAVTQIFAPAAGVVTERHANAGVNVEASTPLFSIVDLSTVWIVGDLYERDFPRVRVGTPATVTMTAYPDLVLEGKVSYIDPALRPETRTAEVRVEVPNRGGQLRLGMYAQVQLGDATGPAAVTIPRTAVQMVGDRPVVYIGDPKQRGRFVEREVRLGAGVGDAIEVVSGIQPGDVVVTKGSFAIRAERERLGLRAAPAAPATAGQVQTARVVVSDQGYEPDRISLRAGIPARITFTRTSDKTCGTEVTIPSLNIKRPLPLNQAVDIEFTPEKSGDVAFVCGMNMLRGTILVQ